MGGSLSAGCGSVMAPGIPGGQPVGTSRSDGGGLAVSPTPGAGRDVVDNCQWCHHSLLPPSPGIFGAARAARGKRASGPGVSCFPLKCALDASAKRAHQTTDTSYGKPFLNCPGWLPTAQDSCQGSLLKMESYFHILLPAGRAPESCHFPICHWILHVSKSNPCLSPAGDAAQRSLESGLCLNINHPQACDCLSQHSSARGTRLMRGRK